MPQQKVWENEYTENRLVTMSDKPQQDFLNFLKFLKRDREVDIENLKVLDLGCGVGKNSIHLAEIGAEVSGIDISDTAIKICKERALKAGVKANFQVANIGSKYPFSDGYFDLVIDVISSNPLNEMERKIYLSEVKRVLKPGGYLFVRALRKDGDKNAKNLLKLSPGKEKNTYIIKSLRLTERVFEENEIKDLYSEYFQILKLDHKSAYTEYENQSYKRNYWLLISTKN